MDRTEFERVMRDCARKMQEPRDPKLIQREISEFAAFMADRRHFPSTGRTPKPSQEILDEEQRREVMTRLERAQAARWVGAVRAAGERPPLAPAPIVSPDTVWSGDLGTLVELCNLGTRRARFLYEQRARRNGRTHEQP